MPRDSSGNYTLPQSPFQPNTTISSTAMNSDLSDIATALTQSVASTGVTPITGQLKTLSGTAAAPSWSFSSDSGAGLYLVGAGQVGVSGSGVGIAVFDTTRVGAGQDGNQFYYVNTAIPSPVGTVADFAGSAAPAGWILCYGQNVSRTSYPELFQVISTTYGSGDGSTTYGLPDCRGRVTLGKDNMGGSTAGRVTAAGGNFDATVLGGTGGQQNYTLLVSGANLPALTTPLTVNIASAQGSHGHPGSTTTAGATGASGSFTNSVVYGNASLTGTSLSIVTNTLPAMTGTLQTNSGAVTPVPVVPPAIVFNKIIFAGRP